MTIIVTVMTVTHQEVRCIHWLRWCMRDSFDVPGKTQEQKIQEFLLHLSLSPPLSMDFLYLITTIALNGRYNATYTCKGNWRQVVIFILNNVLSQQSWTKSFFFFFFKKVEFILPYLYPNSGLDISNFAAGDFAGLAACIPGEAHMLFTKGTAY